MSEDNTTQTASQGARQSEHVQPAQQFSGAPEPPLQAMPAEQQYAQQAQPAQQQYHNHQMPQGAYQNAQPMMYGAQQTPYQATPAPFPDNSTTYIVLSVLEFLFIGGLLAIIPFVFSLQYRDAYLQGDWARAEAKKKNAKIALIVVLVVGIISIIAFAGVIAAGVSLSR